MSDSYYSYGSNDISIDGDGPPGGGLPVLGYTGPSSQVSGSISPSMTTVGSSANILGSATSILNQGQSILGGIGSLVSQGSGLAGQISNALENNPQSAQAIIGPSNIPTPSSGGSMWLLLAAGAGILFLL